MEDIVTAHGLIRPLIFAVSSLVAGLLFLGATAGPPRQPF